MSRFLRRGVLSNTSAALNTTAFVARRSFAASALRLAKEPATSVDVESQDDTDARHTGMERLEKVPWTKLYEGDAILTGKFGTLEEPAIVHSWFPSRIVGCQGSADHPHDILWHEVRRGRDTVCLECGQVFRLRPNLFHQLSEVEADLFPPTEAKESAAHH